MKKTKTYFRRFLDFTYPSTHPLGGQVFPAIVTRDYPSLIEDDDTHRVDLCAFTPTPEGWTDVTVADEPTRGCAHVAFANSDGSASKVRFVAEDEEAQVAEQSARELGMIPAAEQPIEFAPELPGAGEPLSDPTGATGGVDLVATGAELNAETIAEHSETRYELDDAGNPIMGAGPEAGNEVDENDDSADLTPEDAAALEAEIAAEENDPTKGDGGATPI